MIMFTFVRPQQVGCVAMHPWSRKMFFPLVGALAFVCAAQAADPPMPEQTPFAKCRYISFQPTNPGVPTALRVTLSVLPAPFEDYEGMQLWVSSPFEVVDRPNPPTTIQVARLGCEPVYLDWSQVGLLNVGDRHIVPGATFSIDAIAEGCDLSDPSCYSTALSVNTAIWGDVTAGWDGSVWTAPDGSIDITSDAIAVLDKFKNTPTAIPLVCADLQGDVPSGTVEIADVAMTVDAFRGLSYPFQTGFEPCQECPGSCLDNDLSTVDTCVQGICQHNRTPEDARRLLLEVGPIEGFTTGWHEAPSVLPTPNGVVLLFRQAAPPDATVQWNGAVEVFRDDTLSIAECPLQQFGLQSVETLVTLPDGNQAANKCVLNVVDISPDSLIMGSVTATAEPISVDETSSNEVTMEYYFGTESIAALRQLPDGSYLTSVERTVNLNVEVNPRELVSLVEWRIDGRPIALGSTLVQNFARPGRHAISTGPPDYASQLGIETYSVMITSHESGVDIVPEGEAITFTAVTDPPGYEDDITWLSSTKYGTGTPVLGYGPTFTAEFYDTFGPHPDGGDWQWLGVNADNATFNQDQKCDIPMLDPLQAPDDFYEVVCEEELGEVVLLGPFESFSMTSPITPSDPYVPCVDFTAELLESGDLLLDVQVKGVFIVRGFPLGGGEPEFLSVEVGVACEGGKKKADKDGVPKEVEFQEADLIIVETPAGGDNGFAGDGANAVDGEVRASSVQKAVDAICDRFKKGDDGVVGTADDEMPISVIIIGHGNAGDQSIGAGQNKGTDEEDKEFIGACPDGEGNTQYTGKGAAFATGIKGKVSELCLFGCSVGKGSKGGDFLQKLANDISTDDVKAKVGAHRRNTRFLKKKPHVNGDENCKTDKTEKTGE